ncbi:MAG: hypothetical protein ACRYGP_16465 [Janthinobacterium lividum]
MTDAINAAPRREDARDLQAKLYREIGVSAVAAALMFTTKPDSLVRSATVDKPADKAHFARIRAA